MLNQYGCQSRQILKGDWVASLNSIYLRSIHFSNTLFTIHTSIHIHSFIYSSILIYSSNHLSISTHIHSISHTIQNYPLPIAKYGQHRPYTNIDINELKDQVSIGQSEATHPGQIVPISPRLVLDPPHEEQQSVQCLHVLRFLLLET